jgi:predicted Zn-dependent peptidase
MVCGIAAETLDKIGASDRKAESVLCEDAGGLSDIREAVKQMGVSVPQFCIGFKDNDPKNDNLAAPAAVRVLLDLVTGESSGLFCGFRDQGVADGVFGTDYICGAGYGHAVITGTSIEPEKVYRSILNEIEKLKRNGIDEKDFKRIRGKIAGRYARTFDSLMDIVSQQADFFTKGFDVLDMLAAARNVTAGDVYTALESKFNDAVLSIVK